MRALRIMSALIAGVASVGFIIPTPSEASDWVVDAGGGVISAPRSIGSGRQLTIPVPMIEARYRDGFFATDNPYEGVGVAVKLLNGLRLSTSVGLDLDTRDPSADPRVRGLPKASAAGAIRGRVEYETSNWFSSLTVSERLASASSRGLTVATELGYNVVATDRILASIGLDDRIMNAEWARNFLSVTEEESVQSRLPAFNAGAGQLDAGGFLQGLYRLNDRWTVFSRIQYSRFGGDAGTSPVISNRNSVLGLLFIARTW